MEHQKEYYAFISYKREDEKWAKWLQHKLEHYKFPTNLNGRTDLPKNIRPTFRDVTDLKPGLLAEEINNALLNSEWLIVVCSPRAAKSPWVCKEAQTFIDLGRADHIIPFVIEGNPFSSDTATECYPEALLNLTGSKELLAANINEMGRDAAVIKVVARMFNLRFDTLWQRHEKEKRHRRNWIIAAAASFVFAILGVAGYILLLNRQLEIEKSEAIAARNTAEEERNRAENEKNRANKEKNRAEHAEDSVRLQYDIIRQTNSELRQTIEEKSLAQSRAAANAAISLVEKGDSYTARKVAASALELCYSVEAERALRMAHENNNVILKGHESAVFAVAFNPNEMQLVSSSGDKTIRIWDLQNGSCIKVLFEHNYQVNDIAFAPDGLTMASASSDRTIRIWDTKTWNCIDTIKASSYSVTCIAFSHDGKLLISASDYDPSIRIWNARTGELIKTIEGDYYHVSTIEFSANDKCIYAAGGGCVVYTIDVGTGQCLQRLVGHNRWIHSVDISSNGELLVSGSDDKSIRIWDLKSGQCIGTLLGHNESVRSVSFNGRGDKILSSSYDNTICVWDVKTKVCLQKIIGHTNGIHCAKFSPSERYVASCSIDKTVRVWDFQANNLIQEIEFPDAEDGLIGSPSAIFTHDNQYILSNGLTRDYVHGLQAWDANNFDLLMNCKGHSFTAGYHTSTNNGEDFVMHEGNVIYIRNIKYGFIETELVGHTDLVNSALYSYDNNRIVSASRDSTVRLWDAHTNNCIATFVGHSGWVVCAAFSPSGEKIVSSSLDGEMKLWDTRNKKCVNTVKERFSVSIGFSPDGRVICSTPGNVIHLRNALSGTLIKVLAGHTQSITSANYNSSGDYIVSSSYDNTVRVWNAKYGSCIQVIQASSDACMSACFNDSGTKIVSTSREGNIKIWDFPPLQKLLGNTRKQFKDNPLTPEERRQYYLE